jgi:hypothetical protein
MGGIQAKSKISLPEAEASVSKIPPLGDVRVESVSPNPVGDRGSGLGGAGEGEVVTSALPKLRPLGRRAVMSNSNLFLSSILSHFS